MMAGLRSNSDEQDFMKRDLDLNPQQNTGFTENYGAALGVAIDEELSISSIINAPNYKPRNEELYTLVKSGRLPNAGAYNISETPSYTEYNWNELARYAQREGYSIKTDTEILGDKRAEMLQKRQYSESIMNRANAMGSVGKIVGYLNAGAVDPVNVGAAVLGPVAISKYIANINSVRRVMIAEGALGLTSEAAISPFVSDWKETLGVDYTLEDALINMGSAGLLNAGIGGLAAKLGAYIKDAEKMGIDVEPLKIQKRELEKAAEVEEWSDMDPEEFFRRVEEVEKEWTTPTKSNTPEPEEDPFIELNLDENTPNASGEIDKEHLVLDKDGIVDADATLSNLPPVEKGHTRLYRTDSPTVKFGDVFEEEGLGDFARPEGVNGERYTSDLEYADYFRETYGKDAIIKYQDVPNGDLDKFRSTNNPVEFFIEPTPKITAPTHEPIRYMGALPRDKSVVPVVRSRDENGSLEYYIGTKDQDHFDIITDNPNIDGSRSNREIPNEKSDFGYIGKDGVFTLNKSGKAKAKNAVVTPVVKEPELVDEVKAFLDKEMGGDAEIYVSTEDGLQKVKAKDAATALDQRIKDIDDEMGVPICGD